MRAIHRDHKLIKRVNSWRNIAQALAPVSSDGMVYGDFSSGSSIGSGVDDGGNLIPIKIIKGYLPPVESVSVPVPEISYAAPVYTAPLPTYTPTIDPMQALANMNADQAAALQAMVNNPIIINVPETQALIDIAKEVIPELFVPTNTVLQNDLILSQAKQEAISIIKEAQPEVSTTYLESIPNVVELVQMAAVVQESPEVPIKIIQAVVKEQTDASVAESTQTGVYIAPVEPEVYKPVNNNVIPESSSTPVDNTSPAIVEKTNEIIKTMGTQLGLTDKQITTPTTIGKDKNGLYIAGAVVVLGLLALMFKK